MKTLLYRLFGHKPKSPSPLCPITKFNTTLPNSIPPFSEWVKEFRVGMLYDRKIIYIK